MAVPPLDWKNVALFGVLVGFFVLSTSITPKSMSPKTNEAILNAWDSWDHVEKRFSQPESAHQATPRTIWSTFRPSQMIMWFKAHAALQKKVSELSSMLSSSTRNKDTEKVILLMGDSIMESLQGTSYGKPCSRCLGITDVFRRFSRQLSQDGVTPLVLGISGDQTQHLLWRLQNGELPDCIWPSDIILLIGTNNLGVGMTASATLKGILSVVEYLNKVRPKSNLIVIGLLPRERIGMKGLGYDGASVLIHDVNTGLEKYFNENGRVMTLRDSPSFTQTGRGNGRLLFLDVNTLFLNTSGKMILKDLMPDGLHPSAAGWEQLMFKGVTKALALETAHA